MEQISPPMQFSSPEKDLWGPHKIGKQIWPFFEEIHWIQSTKAFEETQNAGSKEDK